MGEWAARARPQKDLNTRRNAFQDNIQEFKYLRYSGTQALFC